jgi:flagellar basal body-associated protein FliL
MVVQMLVVVMLLTAFHVKKFAVVKTALQLPLFLKTAPDQLLIWNRGKHVITRCSVNYHSTALSVIKQHAIVAILFTQDRDRLADVVMKLNLNLHAEWLTQTKRVPALKDRMILTLRGK